MTESHDARRVEMAILETSRVVRHAFNSRLRPYDLNLTQGTILTWVAERGPLTQRQLADLLNITRPSVGAFIDGLEKRGLVERVGDPNDRRVWLITLTPEAKPYVDGFVRIDKEVRDQLRDGMSREERRQLVDLLGRLERNAIQTGQSGELKL
jgi:DNA-binding MarR family transcriptional regulator